MKLAAAFVAFALAGCRTEPPKPTAVAERIEPAWAVPEGGTIAHVKGKNFDPKSRVRVSFGDKEAPLAAVLSKETIQVTVPAAREGESVAVTVRFDDGRAATIPAPFAYRRDEAHAP